MQLDGLAGVMDTYASQHDGVAPVVVIPDDTGTFLGNPLCVHSALGQVDAYLAVDVPAWIARNLQVSTDHVDWAVGVRSYGGTCSLQLAVNHPDVYPTSRTSPVSRSPPLAPARTPWLPPSGATGPDSPRSTRWT